MKGLIYILLFFIFYSCGKDKTSIEYHVQTVKTQSVTNLNLLLKNLNKLSVEVLYEAGAAPYVGNNFRNRPYWSILESNIKAIYDARSMEVDLVIPTQMEQMKLLPSQDKSSWTVSELQNFLDVNKISNSSTTQAVVHVLFVKGHFQNDSGVNSNVLGINITGTTTIVIFKDVVKKMGPSEESAISKFSEQSTLVHEFGHAIGLVNNGVSQVQSHHDSEHGAHCDNSNCVMNWQNEGASEMLEYINNYMNSGSEVMFKSRCLEDLTHF